jgi:hypothetical protein
MLNSFDKNEITIINELEGMLDKQPIEGDRTPVISYERLSGSPFAAGVNASSNAHRLKSIFPDGKVLIVIRNQRDVILSAYFQYLSGGGTHSIKRFLNAKYNGLRPHFSMNHYHYHHIIERYQHLFGKKGVLVLPYELFSGNKEKYLSELGGFINKKINVETIDTKVYRNKNEDHFVRYHFRFLSKFIKSTELNDFPKRHNAVTKKLAWTTVRLLKSICTSALNSRTKLKLSKQLEEHIKNEFGESNQKTEVLTGLDLSYYGYDL